MLATEGPLLRVVGLAIVVLDHADLIADRALAELEFVGAVDPGVVQVVSYVSILVFDFANF